MSDLPPGFEPFDPQAQGRSQTKALPPGFEPYSPPSGTETEAAPQKPPPISPAHPGFIERVLNSVMQGNVFGLPGKSALETSLESTPSRGTFGIFPEGERSAYRPGMTAGQMMGGTPGIERSLGNPMLSAMGPGNMARALPPRPVTPAQSRLQDFTAQGISPSIPAVGQDRAAGLAQQAARGAIGSAVGPGIARNLDEAALATQARAADYGVPSDSPGSGPRNAIRRFGEDKSQGKRDYDEFFNKMHGVPPQPVTQTMQILTDIHKRFPNAPELADVFTRPGMERIRRALEPRTETIPAVTSKTLDQFGSPTIIKPAQTVQRGGVLSVPEIKELRTQIGYLMDEPVVGETSIPKAQLSRLYKAISQDMQTAAATRPDAARALVKAETNFKIRQSLINRLSELASPDAPERVFADINNAAGTGASADSGLLRSAKRVMSPQEWGDLSASIISRLGNPAANQPRPPGTQIPFSINNFGTNWNRLSPKAKEVLFGPDSPGSPRSGLEQLNRVMNDLKNVSHLSNPSRSAEIGLIGYGLTAGMEAMAMGKLPIATMGIAAGMHGMSRVLMSPGFTKWIYGLPNAVRGTDPSMASQIGAATARKMVLGEEGEETKARAPRVLPAMPQKRSEIEEEPPDREPRTGVAGG